MTIGTDLRTFLVNHPPIANLVGPRVHRGTMPQVSQYPAIWYQRRNRESFLPLNGTRDTAGNLPGQGTRDSLARYDFDLEVLADTGEQADEIAELVEEALDGYAGLLGARQVKAVFVNPVGDDYVPRNDASDAGVSVVAVDVTIFST